jgi:hypothetical protein
MQLMSAAFCDPAYCAASQRGPGALLSLSVALLPKTAFYHLSLHFNFIADGVMVLY